MQSDVSSERRLHPRISVREGALVAVHHQVVLGRSVNVSDGGVCLESRDFPHITPGASCTVVIPGVTEERRAIVVAADGATVRLRFIDPGVPADLEDLEPDPGC